MNTLDVRPCDVCGKREVVQVAASRCGAISFAYCRPCLKAGAEPWGALVTYAALAVEPLPQPVRFAPWFESVIERNLIHHDRTREEFARAVRAAEEDMYAAGAGA